jgi:lysophospholipase L1-like esterase
MTFSVVCAGDSNTEGSAVRSAYRYPTVLSGLLTACVVPNTVVNLGVGGYGWDDMVAASATVDAYYSTANVGNTLCCFAGMNDMIYGGAVETCITNMVAYCQARRTVGWRVVVGSVLPSTKDDAVDDYEENRVTVNAYIAAQWETFADAYADWGEDPYISLGNSETQPAYWYNHSHVNADGLALIAGYFYRQIIVTRHHGWAWRLRQDFIHPPKRRERW